MKFYRLTGAAAGLFALLALTVATQPVSGDTAGNTAVSKANRHVFQAATVVSTSVVEAPDYITVEKRFPDERRSVLTRVNRVAIATR